MKPARLSTVALAGVLVCALAACSAEETPTTAAPSATATTAVPSASPSSAAGDPTTAAGPTAAADPTVDKKLCTTAKKIADETKADVVKAATSGGDPNPALKKAYTEMATGLAKATAGSPASEVVTALAAVGVAAGRVATAPDMDAAADRPEFQKTSAMANAACKKAGVDINF
ncbi:hypothetical protein [Micromonospora sp. WMMD987]|uniref:hypothetical protein n=1 Tax=Micromonospora sp. WMMD987 TaxID=3016089 RepID=UPI00249A0ADF|nr:hypothetical protein [Micromonospora sp. WMMD987]WFE94116.1 hypothetical protein O7612_22450 [Micromonospora sp. WMMD987]